MMISDISLGHFFELAVRCVVASVVIIDPNIVLTTAGAADITGIHLHGSDLFYVAFTPTTFLNALISLATWLPTGPSTIITNGT